jgi:hypothetical protein
MTFSILCLPTFRLVVLRIRFAKLRRSDRGGKSGLSGLRGFNGLAGHNLLRSHLLSRGLGRGASPFSPLNPLSPLNPPGSTAPL